MQSSHSEGNIEEIEPTKKRKRSTNTNEKASNKKPIYFLSKKTLEETWGACRHKKAAEAMVCLGFPPEYPVSKFRDFIRHYCNKKFSYIDFSKMKSIVEAEGATGLNRNEKFNNRRKTKVSNTNRSNNNIETQTAVQTHNENLPNNHQLTFFSAPLVIQPFQLIIDMLLHQHGVMLPRTKPISGFSLACVAAQYNLKDIILLLAKRSVNLSEATDEGVTLAHIAVKYGHVEILKTLHELNVDLNGKRSFGLTPSMDAVLRNQLAAVDILKEHVPYTTENTYEGYALLDHAANINVSPEFLSNLSQALCTISGMSYSTYINTKFLYGVIEGNIHSVNTAITLGADIHATDSEGNTAQILAGSPENNQPMIEHLANLSYMDYLDALCEPETTLTLSRKY